MTLRRLLEGEGGPERHFPESWSQGRATFGGLVVGAAVAELRRQVAPERRLRVVQALFAGPVPPGDARVTSEILREGRSMTLAEARVWSNDSARVVVSAGFGLSRESALSGAREVMPDWSAPGQCPPMPYVQGLTPEFTRHCRMVFCEGQVPFSASTQSSHGGWTCIPDEAGDLDEALLVAMLDIWPCPVLQRSQWPHPASTVAWQITLHEVPRTPADGWYAYRSVEESTEDGYHAFRASMWDADGRLLATCHQQVAVFG